MTNSQRLAIVRAHLTHWLNRDFPSGVSEPAQLLGESILICDGYYGGRTFRARVGDTLLTATWFMEPDELKVRSADGEVLASFKGDEIREEISAGVTKPEETPCRDLICLPIPRPDEVNSDRRRAA